MKPLWIPSVPHLTHIETTYSCNLRCGFCYNPKRNTPFNREQMTRIVHAVRDSWIPHVYLIGGEPSLLGVTQLNQYAECLAERSSVTIVTNGQRQLNGLTDAVACIGVPIHGVNGVHERHTNNEMSFRRAIASIRAYVSAGFDVRIIPVLTAWNYNQMYEVIRLAAELGAESVFVDRYEDGGIGSANASELKPTLAQFQEALTQMIAAREDCKIAVGFGTAIPYCLDDRLIREGMFANCGVGITFAAINPDGDVRICNQSQIIYGNVLQKSLAEIWRNPALNEFRDLSWVTEPCRSCAVLHDCLCGCKVDCSCSDHYCVDYAVRENQAVLRAVTEVPKRLLRTSYPDTYRRLRPERFTKLNRAHPEPYLVTRYQTIRLEEAAVDVLMAMLQSNVCDEHELIRSFAESIDEQEIRILVSRLIEARAFTETT